MSFVLTCDLNMKREFVKLAKNSNKKSANDSKRKLPNTR